MMSSVTWTHCDGPKDWVQEFMFFLVYQNGSSSMSNLPLYTFAPGFLELQFIWSSVNFRGVDISQQSFVFERIKPDSCGKSKNLSLFKSAKGNDITGSFTRDTSRSRLATPVIASSSLDRQNPWFLKWKLWASPPLNPNIWNAQIGTNRLLSEKG